MNDCLPQKAFPKGLIFKNLTLHFYEQAGAYHTLHCPVKQSTAATDGKNVGLGVGLFTFLRLVVGK